MTAKSALITIAEVLFNTFEVLLVVGAIAFNAWPWLPQAGLSVMQAIQATVAGTFLLLFAWYLRYRRQLLEDM